MLKRVICENDPAVRLYNTLGLCDNIGNSITLSRLDQPDHLQPTRRYKVNMLRELSIVNFAIIDDLKISFPDGLSILSGETGAGKSIIINAANLLLGMRATARLIRTGADQAELEALFQVPAGSRAAEIMEAQGYDVSESLLIKRIITRNERHRIYLNGRLATTQLLASATEYLASISGQHAHQGLLKEDENLRNLDQFGGLLPN